MLRDIRICKKKKRIVFEIRSSPDGDPLTLASVFDFYLLGEKSISESLRPTVVNQEWLFPRKYLAV